MRQSEDETGKLLADLGAEGQAFVEQTHSLQITGRFSNSVRMIWCANLDGMEAQRGEMNPVAMMGDSSCREPRASP
jgi:hypothetical protein